MKGKWQPAEPYRAKECEAAFQNGGPRVFYYEEWRASPFIKWTTASAAGAAACADADETVYARRKRGQQWVWMKWVMPLTREQAAAKLGTAVAEFTGTGISAEETDKLIAIVQRIKED